MNVTSDVDSLPPAALRISNYWDVRRRRALHGRIHFAAETIMSTIPNTTTVSTALGFGAGDADSGSWALEGGRWKVG